jgi:hypothetical protein
MPSQHEYASGEVIANKYVVENALGESPAARAYLANGGSGRLVVKVYGPETSAALLAAPDFFLKAVVLTEIAHDNLAVCSDIQEEMGRVFAARAFAEGESFEAWTRAHRGEPGHFARGLECLWQACQGLAALHERTRHLNIHPGNLIVGPVAARLCDPDPRALGATEMTPAPLPSRPEYRGYRAPEMAGRSGGFLSYPSTDLFAVAGLLYRLVKGEDPPANPAQTLAEARALDRDLALFLGKALHPRPEERFQDASAFADALWELQGTMQRLQASSPRTPAGSVPSPAFRAPDPVPDPFAAAEAVKDTTVVGGPQRSANPTGDSFFDFFPAAGTEAPPAASAASGSARPAPSAGSGDTLFGTPAPPPPQPARPQSRHREPPPHGGLSDLEQPGTLFGDPAPVFGGAPKPAPRSAPRSEPPPPPKPAAVSLSALERDPLEASANDPGSFTTYGFKDAGDNRTGIYNPDGKSAAARARLRLLIGVSAAIVIVTGLAVLFVFLRGNAADQAKPAAANIAAEEPPAPPAANAEEPAPEPAPAEKAPGPAADASPGKPYPEVAATETPEETPPPAADRPVPPADRRGSGAAARPAADASDGSARLEELMSMIRTRNWPASAAERLKAADELNDFGKIAEANLLYGKALAAAGTETRAKISALGGLAATFQAMGMKPQALDAVNKLLEVSPGNSFALRMKAKLQ